MKCNFNEKLYKNNYLLIQLTFSFWLETFRHPSSWLVIELKRLTPLVTISTVSFVEIGSLFDYTALENVKI